MARLPRGVSRTAGGWQVRLVVGRRDGRPIRRKATFPTATAAAEFVARAQLERAYGRFGQDVPAERPERLTLAVAVEKAEAELAALGRSKVYQTAQRRDHRILLAALGPHQPMPLTRDGVVAVLAYVRDNRRTGGALTKSVLQTLRTTHRRLGLAPPPTPMVKTAYVGRRQMALPELRAFLAALPPGSIERTVSLLILLTAAREAEVHRLRLRDWDGERLTYRRKSARGGRESVTVVGVIEPVKRLLGEWVASLPPGLPPDAPMFSMSFPGAARQPLQVSSLARRIAEVAPGMTGNGFLRNQAATILGTLRVPDEIIDRILAHSLGVLGRYNRADRGDECLDALRRLYEAVFAGGHAGATRKAGKASRGPARPPERP